MRLSAPTQGVFFASLILAILGFLASQGIISQLSQYSFWLVVIGYIVLMFGNLVKGL